MPYTSWKAEMLPGNTKDLPVKKQFKTILAQKAAKSEKIKTFQQIMLLD